MTDDHFPPESTALPGDTAPAPRYCPECDRHVVSSHDHDPECPEWRGNDDPDGEQE